MVNKKIPSFRYLLNEIDIIYMLYIIFSNSILRIDVLPELKNC